MKHLMRYEGYSTKERVDDILDKISKYGLSSITSLEKEFLDSYKTGKEEETHNKIARLENEIVFIDEPFKFEYKETRIVDGEINYFGTIYVPDLILKNGKRIEGRLEGSISINHNKQSSANFEKNGYDIFDFCTGLEYEIDNFIDYIVIELEERNNKF